MNAFLRLLMPWRRVPPPIFVAAPTGLQPIVLPPQENNPALDLCWAAWDQIVATENVATDATKCMKESGIEKEWRRNLAEGRAVMCILSSFPGGLGVANPGFDYPAPASLEWGLQKYFFDWQLEREPYADTMDVTIYRLDLGPCKIDPEGAYRAQVLGVESVVLQQIKKQKAENRRNRLGGRQP